MAKTLDSIRNLFPEIEHISDPELREKVLRTWLEAWKLSHFDQIEQVPFIRGMLPEINLVDHTRTVTAICVDIANVLTKALNVPINMDHLIAGSILHDLGKLFEYSKTPPLIGRLFTHAISAVYIAAKEGLPLEVIHIIATHSLEGDLAKRTTEATILHSLDFAYAEVAFRSKVGISVDEWRKSTMGKE